MDGRYQPADKLIKHVRDLNEQLRQSEEEERGDTAIASSTLIPARLEPSAILQPRKTPVEYVIETFEGASDDRLRQLCKELFSSARNERGKPYLDNGYFAVLDERSVQDKTVIFHAEHLNPDDDSDETRYWRKWRIRWVEAYHMSVTLAMTLDIVHQVYLQSDRFIDEDGIFPVQQAVDQVGREGPRSHEL